MLSLERKNREYMANRTVANPLVEVQGSIEPLNKALKEGVDSLNKFYKDVDAIGDKVRKSLNDMTAGFANRLDILAQRVNGLSVKITTDLGDITKAAKAVSTEMVDMGVSVGGTAAPLKDLTTNARDAGSQLRGMGIAARQGAVETEASAKKAVTAIDSVTAAAKAAKAAARTPVNFNVGTSSRTAAGHGAGAGGWDSLFIGGAILGGLAEMVKAGSDVEDSIRRIQATAGDPRPYEEIRKEVLGVATAYGQMGKETADALYMVESSGIQGAQGLQVLTAAAAMARGTLAPLDEVSNLLVKTLKTYRLGADDSSRATDIFTRAIKDSLSQGKDFVPALENLLETGKSAGLSVEELSAALATLTQTTKSPITASTYLLNLLNRIINPTKTTREWAHKAGIAWLEYGNGVDRIKQVGFDGVLNDISKATNNTVQGMQKLFPDLRTSRAELSLLNDGGIRYKQTLNDLRDSHGAVAKANQVMDQSFAQTIRDMKAQFNTLSSDVETTLAPTLTELFKTLDTLLKDFIALPPATKNTITSILAVAGAFLTLRGGFVILRVALLSLIPAGAAASGGLLAAFGPTALWVVGIVAAVALVWKLVDALNHVKPPANLLPTNTTSVQTNIANQATLNQQEADRTSARINDLQSKIQAARSILANEKPGTENSIGLQKQIDAWSGALATAQAQRGALLNDKSILDITSKFLTPAQTLQADTGGEINKIKAEIKRVQDQITRDQALLKAQGTSAAEYASRSHPSSLQVYGANIDTSSDMSDNVKEYAATQARIAANQKSLASLQEAQAHQEARITTINAQVEIEKRKGLGIFSREYAEAEKVHATQMQISSLSLQRVSIAKKLSDAETKLANLKIEQSATAKAESEFTGMGAHTSGKSEAMMKGGRYYSIDNSLNETAATIKASDSIQGLTKQIADLTGQASEADRGISKLNSQVSTVAVSTRPTTGLRNQQWASLISAAHAQHPNVPIELIDAIMTQESGGHPKSSSGAGAVGLMQLMPGTAKGLGVNPYDNAQNVLGGTALLDQNLKRYGGNLRQAIAAYYSGGGNDLSTKPQRGGPSIKDYVDQVLEKMGPGRSGDLLPGATAGNGVVPKWAQGGLSPTKLSSLTEPLANIFGQDSAMTSKVHNVLEYVQGLTNAAQKSKEEISETNDLAAAQKRMEDAAAASGRAVDDHALKVELDTVRLQHLHTQMTLATTAYQGAISYLTTNADRLRLLRDEYEAADKAQRTFYESHKSGVTKESGLKATYKNLEDNTKSLKKQVEDLANQMNMQANAATHAAAAQLTLQTAIDSTSTSLSENLKQRTLDAYEVMKEIQIAFRGATERSDAEGRMHQIEDRANELRSDPRRNALSAGDYKTAIDLINGYELEERKTVLDQIDKLTRSQELELAKFQLDMGNSTMDQYTANVQSHLVDMISKFKQGGFADMDLAKEIETVALELKRISWQDVDNQLTTLKEAMDDGKISAREYILDLQKIMGTPGSPQALAFRQSPEYAKTKSELDKAYKSLAAEQEKSAKEIGKKIGDPIAEGIMDALTKTGPKLREKLKELLISKATDELKTFFSKMISDIALKNIQKRNPTPPRVGADSSKTSAENMADVQNQFDASVSKWNTGVDTFGGIMAQFIAALDFFKAHPQDLSGIAVPPGGVSGTAAGAWGLVPTTGTANPSSVQKTINDIFTGVSDTAKVTGNTTIGSAATLLGSTSKIVDFMGDFHRHVVSPLTNMTSSQKLNSAADGIQSLSKLDISKDTGSSITKIAQASNAAFSAAKDIAGISKAGGLMSSLGAVAPYLGIATALIGAAGLFGSDKHTPTKTYEEKFNQVFDKLGSTVNSGYSGNEGLRQIIGASSMAAAGVHGLGIAPSGSHDMNVGEIHVHAHGMTDPVTFARQAAPAVMREIARQTTLDNARRGGGPTTYGSST